MAFSSERGPKTSPQLRSVNTVIRQSAGSAFAPSARSSIRVTSRDGFIERAPDVLAAGGPINALPRIHRDPIETSNQDKLPERRVVHGHEVGGSITQTKENNERHNGHYTRREYGLPLSRSGFLLNREFLPRCFRQPRYYRVHLCRRVDP